MTLTKIWIAIIIGTLLAIFLAAALIASIVTDIDRELDECGGVAECLGESVRKFDEARKGEQDNPPRKNGD